MIELTEYERKIVRQLLSSGGTDKDIASRLGLSHWSVKSALYQINQKTGQDNRLGLALFTLRNLDFLAYVMGHPAPQ